MSASRPNLDNACASKLPFGGQFLALPNRLNERCWPETPSDDQPADPVGNVKQPVDNFDLGRVLQQYGGVQTSIKHLIPLHSLATERAKGAATSGESKTVTQVKSCFRRTAESLRRAVSVTSDSGTPANDNPANDDWHPLEAA